MLDIRFIRENADLVQKKAEQKGYKVDVKKLLSLDEKHRTLWAEIEVLRRKGNELAKAAGGKKPSDEQIKRGSELKKKESQIWTKMMNTATIPRENILLSIPNVFPEDTPLGGEEANREERKWGDTADKSFEVLDHATWAEKHGLLDFERGAKVAGNKFYYTAGSLVQLELALTQLAMKVIAENGYTPMLVPHLVSGRMIDGTGFSARTKEEEQIYKIDGEDLHLIATAEIPLTAYHADEIIDELPRAYAGYSPAYRKEAGAYGKHSRGLYRVHQFNKVEMYVFCKPEDSEQWHKKMVELEENICQMLEIPYRVVRIAAGDLGAAAYKKYDVEYWSPPDKAYRELMSCSNVTDYQARRLNIRYRTDEGGTNYVHTLNGTAGAMSRLPIAIIENFQTKDGKVELPKALHPYMNGQTTL